MIGIIKITAHRWSNIFSEYPVLQAEIEGGSARGISGGRGVAEALSALANFFLVFEFERKGALDKTWADFLNQLKNGQNATVGDLLAAIALGVQKLDGSCLPCAFGSCPSLEEGRESVFVAYQFEQPACTALMQAVGLLNDLERDPDGAVQRVERMIEGFSELGFLGGLELLTRSVVEVAEKRNISWRVIEPAMGMIRLGEGRKQVHFADGFSDADSALGVRLCVDRYKSLQMLQRRGIKVGDPLIASSLDAVKKIVLEADQPMLVRSVMRMPEDDSFVFLNQRNAVSERAVVLLNKTGSVLFQSGGSELVNSHRVVLVGGRFLMAYTLGAEAGADSVVEVHPDNARMAERVVAAVGLKTAELVILSRDMGKSWIEEELNVLNLASGLPSRSDWDENQRAQVAEALIDFLFPDGRTGRIAKAAVTGTNGKTTTCRMLEHILSGAGESVGLTTTSGVQVGGKINGSGDAAACQGTLAVLDDSSVDVAVLELARGGLLDAGVAFEYCEVAAVLNVTEDHLGVDGIETLQQLAEVKARVAKAARNLLVLNADDPLTVEMAKDCGAERVAFVSSKGRSDFVDKHIQAGGMALIAGDLEGAEEKMYLLDGGKSLLIGSVADLPSAMGGKARHNVFNALVASGLAYGLDVSLAKISERLKSFHSDFSTNPGRLNVFDDGPFTVIIDFAHNPEGIEAACETVAQMEVSGRRLVVLGTSGNRHGEHIERAARFVAGGFDRYWCTRDNTYSILDNESRGFPAEEIPKRLADALCAQGVDSKGIEVVGEFQKAFAQALGSCAEGDLLLVFTDEYVWCRDQILDKERTVLKGIS